MLCGRLSFFFFLFLSHRFRSIKDGRLIQLVRRDMHTDQTLFSLGIEPSIPWIHPWKELLATGAQRTWFFLFTFMFNNNNYC